MLLAPQPNALRTDCPQPARRQPQTPTAETGNTATTPVAYHITPLPVPFPFHSGSHNAAGTLPPPADTVARSFPAQQAQAGETQHSQSPDSWQPHPAPVVRQRHTGPSADYNHTFSLSSPPLTACHDTSGSLSPSMHAMRKASLAASGATP